MKDFTKELTLTDYLNGKIPSPRNKNSYTILPTMDKRTRVEKVLGIIPQGEYPPPPEEPEEEEE